jgi:hypothetical protein
MRGPNRRHLSPGGDASMSAGRRRSILGDGRDVAGAFCALALAFLAGLAGGASPWHGSGDAPSASAGALHVVLPVGGVALVTALFLLWVATPAPRSQRRSRRRAAPQDVEGAATAAWTGVKAGAAVMLAVAAICLAAWPLLTTNSAPTPAGGRPSSATPPPQRNAERGRTVDLAWLLLPAALALALLAPAAVVVRRRQMPRTVAVGEDSPVLARGVRASIERLEAERDPRRAIVLAYECMEEAFREVEIVRARDETSSEFLLRSTRRLPVGADAASRLTERFEEARFSAHEVDETHRREALASLRRVERALEGSR